MRPPLVGTTVRGTAAFPMVTARRFSLSEGLHDEKSVWSVACIDEII
jgi:hypothetical protein